jgi:SET domain-containing protein
MVEIIPVLFPAEKSHFRIHHLLPGTLSGPSTDSSRHSNNALHGLLRTGEAIFRESSERVGNLQRDLCGPCLVHYDVPLPIR